MQMTLSSNSQRLCDTLNALSIQSLLCILTFPLLHPPVVGIEITLTGDVDKIKCPMYQATNLPQPFNDDDKDGEETQRKQHTGTLICLGQSRLAERSTAPDCFLFCMRGLVPSSPHSTTTLPYVFYPNLLFLKKLYFGFLVTAVYGSIKVSTYI